jgi:hypothetical protein
MANQFVETAAARAEALNQKIASFTDAASTRYMFTPIFDMIEATLSTTIPKGEIVPISEQSQPVGEVYLMTLVRDGETLDPRAYDLKDGVGAVIISPAAIVDGLLNQYGPQGAVQIKCLFGMGIEKFLGHSLNEIIFDGRQYETAEAYLERFEFVRDQIKGASVEPLVSRVLSEIEASVNAALAWAKMKAEWSNNALKRGDLKKFAIFEDRIFRFSGVTPIDEAMNQVAVNQASLANSLPTVIEGLQATIEKSSPDWKTIGASIAEGVKEGVQAAISAVLPQASQSKEEQPKQPAPKGGNKS